ncbi:hypothetical protein RFI_02786 [Reticulomyxa filosa]|uniref:USP domain-containing protein n=1 Tax=Reticulomyxa filosa TaxID=46433 RepID=X6P866_RETFI|nr:hypothetical protein RFI_02786 [Reticulomyxa filosa]|eukprot:ETO34308.1 hypothetical protein RFI_02786 [Reticulomyxa filosa]
MGGLGPLGADTSYSLTGSELTKPKAYVSRQEPVYALEPSKYDPNSKHLYVLTGVVIHRGTPHHGHYHAYLRDLMWEGPRKKPVKESNDSEKDKQSTKSVIYHLYIHILYCISFATLTHIMYSIGLEDADQCWYDFNDSMVSPIDKATVARQYGGSNECAYMLVYRRVDRMNILSVPLPPSLQQYIDEFNANLKRDRLRVIEEEMPLKSKSYIRLDNTVTMQPFIDSLLKQLIRTGRLKQMEKEMDFQNEKKDSSKNAATSVPTSDASNATATTSQSLDSVEAEEKIIEEAFMNGAYPQSLSLHEVESIVAEWFQKHTLLVKVDGRKPVDVFLPLLKEECKRIIHDDFEFDKFQLHFISITSDKFNQIE